MGGLTHTKKDASINFTLSNMSVTKLFDLPLIWPRP
uniref:Uncharacterized protein n=1 Tax=Arundo donax TaxID=35708 RepID=A0A0A9C7L6_ARUDO